MNRDWPTSKSGGRLPALLALVLLLSCSFPAGAGDTVFKFTGSASRTTPEFQVKAPWLLEWRTVSDGNPQMAVDISLHQAGTGVYQGRVLTTKFPGNGAKLFDRSGEFYFRTDASFATWTLEVVELSEHEAALYTPRSEDG